ncbi:MAG: hypothetical protein LBL66_04340 [Clostridiales bacterium]|jgi:hypothetical protein|nr:hypothetical protein [Clostridiales bacterium]
MVKQIIVKKRAVCFALSAALAACAAFLLFPSKAERQARADNSWISEWTATAGAWNASGEGGETVWTGGTSADSATYTGSLSGVNSVEMDVRFNKATDPEASSPFSCGLFVNAGSEIGDYYFDFIPAGNAFRLRWYPAAGGSSYLAAVVMPVPYAANQWTHWQVVWDAARIALFVDGKFVLSYNFGINGMHGVAAPAFSDAGYITLNQWEVRPSVKNLSVGTAEIPSGGWPGEWTTAGWNASDEGGETVWTGSSSVQFTQYTGNYAGVNFVEMDVRLNQTSIDVPYEHGYNCGIRVETSSGIDYYYSLMPGGTQFCLWRDTAHGNNLMVSTGTMPFYTATQWAHWQIVWDRSNIYLFVDNAFILMFDYKTRGDSMDEISSVRFNQWGVAASIKNLSVKTGQPVPAAGWQRTGWTEAQEGGKTVYTSDVNTDFNLMPYIGSMGEFNCVEFDMRVFSFRWQDGNVGFIVSSADGAAEYFFEYNMAGRFRLRRMPKGGGEEWLGTVDYPIALNAWTKIKIVFEEDFLVLYANGGVVMAIFDTHGDVFGDGSSCRVNSWMAYSDIVGPTLSHVEKDYKEAGYLDLEFNGQNAVAGFAATGGELFYSDGQMRFDISAAGAQITSPRINALRGTPYSMFLPVRNTFAVRLKNESGADRLTLGFMSSKNESYSKAREKEFAIEPNSGWKTYFFNLSDLIDDSAYERDFKYASQLTGSEGYLRGFRFGFPSSAAGGSVYIDAITFEREDNIYPYAGEIISCTADAAAKTVTVRGRVGAQYTGLYATILESSVMNYNERLNHSDIKPIVNASIQMDGTFTATFPLYGKGKVSYLSAYFLASVNGVKVSKTFTVENYRDFDDTARFTLPLRSVRATDAPFNAKGDAFTDDTNAIQMAVDYISAQGGGTVILPGEPLNPYGRRYVATNIQMKSNVELQIEKGAVIWQSQRLSDYQYEVVHGHDINIENAPWAAAPNLNLPLIQICNVQNVRVSGGGTVRMADVGAEILDGNSYAWESDITVGDGSVVCVNPFGAYNSKGVDITDITILRTNFWHMWICFCEDIYIANVDEKEANSVNADGFDLSRSKNAIINRCFMYSSDDAVVLSTFYNDNRGKVWWFSDPGADNAMENVVVKHSQLYGGHGITLIPWGSADPDFYKEEIRNIEVFDCILGGTSTSVGGWPDNPFYGTSAFTSYNQNEQNDYSPMKDIYIHDNVYLRSYQLHGALITNLITDMPDASAKSPSQFLHGSFDKVIRSTTVGDGFQDETDWVVGLSNWSVRAGENGAAGTEIVRSDLKYSGYIAGDGKLFQGLYLVSGAYEFTIKVKAVSGASAVFAADALTGNVIAEKAAALNSDFTALTLKFNVREDTTIHLGVRHEGAAGEKVYLDDASVIRTGLPGPYKFFNENFAAVVSANYVYETNHHQLRYENGATILYMDAAIGESGTEFGTEYAAFDLQVKFRFNAFTGADGAFGVFWGDSEIYYRLSDGKWVYGDGDATAVSESAFALSAGQWYIVSLRASGGVCGVYFNGGKVLEFNTNTGMDRGLKIFSRGVLSSLASVAAAEAETLDMTVKTDSDVSGQSAADPVTAAIGALPATDSLTLNDKSAVEAARAAYDGLAPAQKSLVANYGKLTAAEAKIAELENDGGSSGGDGNGGNGGGNGGNGGNGGDSGGCKNGCGQSSAAAVMGVVMLAAFALLRKRG